MLIEENVVCNIYLVYGFCFNLQKRSKSKPLHDDDFDETFITEDELELEDVEYRETLAIKHGQDPDKIWKSERLKKFMVRRSINLLLDVK